MTYKKFFLGIAKYQGIRSYVRWKSFSTIARDVDRQYFYVMDDKAQLFLHDCKHKNFVSCLKDKTFLNMFYRLLRRCPKDFRQIPIEEQDSNLTYPLISPCGRELNYLRIEDSLASLVYGSIVLPSTFSKSNPITEGKFELVLGQSELRQEFHPKHLSVDSATGRFYHTILNHRYLKGDPGLLHGYISQQLSCLIVPVDSSVTTPEEVCFVMKWNDGQEYPIREINPQLSPTS